MDHKAARKKLSEYLDDAVADEERRAIETHLESCASCRDALAELRQTIGHIKRIEDVDPPPWMTSRIMAHVREEAQRKWSWRRLFAPAVLRPAMSGVAIAFVTAVAIYVYQNIQPEVSFREMPALPEAAAPVGQEKEKGPAPPPKKVLSEMRPEATPKAAPPQRREVAQDQAIKDRAMEDLSRKDEEKAAAPPTAMAGTAAQVREEMMQAPGAAAPAAPPAPAELARPAAPYRFTLQAKDTDAAATEIKGKIARLGGTVKSSQVSEGRRIIRGEVPATKISGLSRAIGSLGPMTATPAPSGYNKGNVEILVVISSP